MEDNKLINRNYLFFALIFIVMSFFIMKSFMFGILWGIVIAVSVWPLFEKTQSPSLINTHLSKPVIFTLVFCFFFVGPLIYAAYQIADVYGITSNYIEKNTVNGVLNYPQWFNLLPLHEKIIDFWNTNLTTGSNFMEMISHLTKGKIFNLFSSFWSEVFDRLTSLFVMIVTFYFMLKNGLKVQANYKNVFSYWLGSRGVHHIDNGISSLRGTINGVVLIGILEGVLLALPLMFAGITSGLLIGLCAGLLGVIPMLMPALILPCLAYLFVNGDTAWAVVGAFDLAIVWFIFENIVKPQMISKKVKINSLIILASMIGGLQMLGPVGLFLGPSIVSMGIGMMTDFLTMHRHEQCQTSPEVKIETTVEITKTIEKSN